MTESEPRSPRPLRVLGVFGGLLTRCLHRNQGRPAHTFETPTGPPRQAISSEVAALLGAFSLGQRKMRVSPACEIKQFSKVLGIVSGCIHILAVTHDENALSISQELGIPHDFQEQDVRDFEIKVRWKNPQTYNRFQNRNRLADGQCCGFL